MMFASQSWTVAPAAMLSEAWLRVHTPREYSFRRIPAWTSIRLPAERAMFWSMPLAPSQTLPVPDFTRVPEPEIVPPDNCCVPVPVTLNSSRLPVRVKLLPPVRLLTRISVPPATVVPPA